MAKRDSSGRIVETDEEASQGEKSPDTFVMLVVSLVALAIIGVALFWYFGVFG